MKINLVRRLRQYTIKLPGKCNNCDSEYKDKARGSCDYCYLHGYKELGNGAEEIKEYNEDINDYDGGD